MAVTQLLQRWRSGDQNALDELLPLIYGELRRIADLRLNREAPHATGLKPTELVHEAYLRLAGGAAVKVNDRAHFLAIAARVMRQVLVDRARARQASKRDGGQPVTLANLAENDPRQNLDVLNLDQALERLNTVDPRKARLVELRLFAGLDFAELGEVMELSRATLDREFRAARAWLYRELSA
ncbi:sigma-70 family RNA polymerase sigma factor [Wenzhouxiangella sp. AB-CW3]|uniref:ECF-type sigma factor n=1 Tax=Wenzhouxiangella sp. AB-CW3 TaxID=2771012 RepID=UPI00168A7E49|nr:ECF-type sigma factor [Wenzhouxiangella sp. AB-CW3]QOC23935.1 sigma-70 family RNA polymerase sigma factor [Wenzhouxiangella sp. AB-CW3]